LTNQDRKRALYQKLPLTRGNSFVIGRFISPYFETPWHFHEEYELVYCEAGFGKKFIGDSFSEYYQGEMALIGKNVPHLYKADDSFYDKEAVLKPSSLVIQFSEDFLGKSFFSTPEMSEMRQVLSLSISGLEITGQTKEKIRDVIYGMMGEGKTGKLKCLIEIFHLLSVSKELQPLSLKTVSGINLNDSAKMQKVLDYALSNFKEEITIREAAKLVNFSPSAFCRYFKSRTQKSFLSFVIEMRLIEACKMLKETNLPVLDICYRTGFKNLSNFNRLFRKQFNQNPLVYRKTSGV
jgi:AraC-like DNA-binding protein/quercetin dioxygenase-like cupin family protein